MVALDDNVSLLLKKNKYIFNAENDVLVILNKSFATVYTTIISVVIGLPLMIFGVTSDGKIFILGLLMVAIPFIYGRWRFPKRIVVDWKKRSLVLNKGLFAKKSLNIDTIEDMHVERQVKSSHVSAFEEGNQDFLYSFYIQPFENKRERFIRLQFRKDMDDEMRELAASLATYIKRNEDSED